MNNISKSHQKLAYNLNNSRVLTNPEKFLGPNFKAVLNFWLSIDDLTEDQWEAINSRECDFYNNQQSEWDKASEEVIKASNQTIGSEFAYHASYAAWNVYISYAAFYATYELIGMHLILEQQKALTFFNMFLEVL